MKNLQVCMLILLFAGLTCSLDAQPQYYNYNTSGSANSFPFNITTGKDVQLLYLPGDFNQPAPAPAGGIESVSFMINSGYPLGPWTYTDLTIKMGQSSIVSFDAGTFYTGSLTTVYYRASVSLTGTAGQWMTILLDTPFPYNPAQSLIIDVGQCAAAGATGFSACFTAMTGNRRNYSVGGCPFVYAAQNTSVYHMGISLCTTVPVPTITGNNNVCVNSGYYTYSTEPGMTNYTWNVSAGGLITGGIGTNQITVFWNTAGAQTVSVNYTNVCGKQAVTPTFLNVTVNDLPAAAGSITGVGTVNAGATGVPYTVAPIAGATTYIWTLVPGATFASGQWTNNITVDFPSYAASGFMTVLGNNMCGNGAASPGFYVNVVTGIAEAVNNAAVSIYPNPGDGLFTLQISSASQETYTIQILNTLGSMIIEIKDILVNGTVEKVVDLRPNANGVYTVVIRNSSSWIVKKVLLNR